jgi:hypothetical protein
MPATYLFPRIQIFFCFLFFDANRHSNTFGEPKSHQLQLGNTSRTSHSQNITLLTLPIITIRQLSLSSIWLPKYPSFIKTDEAREFWKDKRIKDIDTIRVQPSTFTYVALDCEGQEGYGDGVTSIGLALLPSTHPPEIFQAWPWRDVNLDNIVLSYNIRSLSLRIPERHRGRVPEPFRYGDVDSVPRLELEHYICQYVEAAKQQEQKSLILVVWGIENEMRAIVSLFPGLLSILDGWIDLADIITYMSGIRTKAKRSLRDTLLTFGLEKNYSVQTLCPHDPGMDAVRTTAALAGLVVCPMRELVIPNWTQQEKESRSQKYKRPSKDIYPYAIRICTQDGSPLPAAISSPPKLEEFVKIQFANPAAVAVCPPSKRDRRKMHKTHGWICFDSVEAMECLVQQLNGCEVNGVGLSLCISGPSKSIASG